MDAHIDLSVAAGCVLWSIQLRKNHSSDIYNRRVTLEDHTPPRNIYSIQFHYHSLKQVYIQLTLGELDMNAMLHRSTSDPNFLNSDFAQYHW